MATSLGLEALIFLMPISSVICVMPDPITWSTCLNRHKNVHFYDHLTACEEIPRVIQLSQIEYYFLHETQENLKKTLWNKITEIVS